MLPEKTIKLAVNHAYTLCGRRLPMGSIYYKQDGAYYLVSDFTPFYNRDKTRRDKNPDGEPMTKRKDFYVEVLKPHWHNWVSYRVPLESDMGRLIMRHMMEKYPADSTIPRTVHASVHDRTVAPYTKRPNWGQYEHRSRYNCTEQRVPTALIGTGVKSH